MMPGVLYTFIYKVLLGGNQSMHGFIPFFHDNLKHFPWHQHESFVPILHCQTSRMLLTLEAPILNNPAYKLILSLLNF